MATPINTFAPLTTDSVYSVGFSTPMARKGINYKKRVAAGTIYAPIVDAKGEYMPESIWSSLPRDVLKLIFESLPIRKWSTLSLLSKKWRSYCYDEKRIASWVNYVYTTFIAMTRVNIIKNAIGPIGADIVAAMGPYRFTMAHDDYLIRNKPVVCPASVGCGDIRLWVALSVLAYRVKGTLNTLNTAVAKLIADKAPDIGAALPHLKDEILKHCPAKVFRMPYPFNDDDEFDEELIEEYEGGEMEYETEEEELDPMESLEAKIVLMVARGMNMNRNEVKEYIWDLKAKLTIADEKIDEAMEDMMTILSLRRGAVGEAPISRYAIDIQETQRKCYLLETEINRHKAYLKSLPKSIEP
jgi:polyhydroxyalkanoate synthesis regulator phasin